MGKIGLNRLLAVILLVPLLALGAFGTILVDENLQTYRRVESAAALQRLVSAATQLSAMILPNEGRATYPFLADGTPDQRAKMLEQRAITDRAISDFNKAAAEIRTADAKTLELVRTLQSRLASLAGVREQADRRATTRNDMGAFLQANTGLANDLIGRIAGLVDDVRITRLILALQASLEISTGNLNEGGRGEIAFKDRGLSPELYRVLHRGVEMQAAFGKQLDVFAPGSIAAEAKAFDDTPHGRLIARVRPILLDFAYDRLDPADAKPWTEADQARRGAWLRIVAEAEAMLADETNALRKAAWDDLVTYAAVGLVVLVLVTGLGFLVLRTIRRLFSGLSRTMEALARNDLQVSVPGCDRADELGAMARSVEVFKQNAIAMRALEAEQEIQKERAQADKRSAVNTLAQDFQQAVGDIIEAVSSAAGQLQGAARTMTSAAEETSMQSAAVANNSHEAASNVQTVSAATEELSISIQEIARQVTDSARIATQAVQDADATAAKVERLSHAASKIGEVVDLISTIAGHTNLLALNATIEAARAGEAGRGFAVVAQEVKALAEKTAKATAEISAQIAEVQTSTEESAAAIHAITGVIRTVNDTANSIAVAVEQQGYATQEIAQNVGRASERTREVSSNIAGVRRAADDSSAASAQVLASASELSRQSSMLESAVTRFLSSIRAA